MSIRSASNSTVVRPGIGRAAFMSQSYNPSTPIVLDANFNQVTLLLQGDGTNGGQNNTFLDSSTNNFTITRNGNTTQGSFSPYGDLWSNYFDGSGDYFSTPSNAAFGFGTGDYTIEAFVYPQQFANQQIFNFSDDRDNLSLDPAGTLTFYDGSVYTTTATYVLNTWQHIAYVRSSGTVTIYLNGVSIKTISSNYNSSARTLYIGARGIPTAGTNCLLGYMSNVRVIKGTAIYTSAFTPSTTSLTAITNTSLLTCQSNRFIDNSANNFALTVSGTPSVQRFSPFNPTSAYSTSVIGGSGYFDGSGDYLVVGSSASLGIGSSDFTIELWWYPTAWSSGAELFSAAAGDGTNRAFAMYTDGSNGTLKAYAGTGGSSWDIINALSMGTAVLNQWNHMAFTRSGTTFATFLNGNRITTTTASGTIGSKNIGVGAGYSGLTPAPASYLSNCRVVAGTALYTASTYTIPSAPLTAVSGTTALTNFTNGAIYDSAMMNDLETVGNAQISTSVKKYGTGSMYFDGTGDYLQAPYNDIYNFGTGDFTVEFWINASASGSYTAVVGTLVSGTEAGTWRVGNRFNSTNAVYFARGNGSGFDEFNAAVNVNDGAWHHVAVTRASGTVRIFVDGIVGASQSITGTCTSANPLKVGYNSRDDVYITGYIDDLRITKGYARYTTTFTPPTAALPNY